MSNESSRTMWLCVYKLVGFRCWLGKANIKNGTRLCLASSTAALRHTSKTITSFYLTQCWCDCFRIWNFRAKKKKKKTMIWFSIDIVVWFLHGDWTDPKMSMLLRKELESLELTYPDETSPALNSTDTNQRDPSFASTKVFMKWQKNPFNRLRGVLILFFLILQAKFAIAQWRSHTASQWEEGKTFHATRSHRWRARLNGHHHQWSVVVSDHCSTACIAAHTWSAHTKLNSNLFRSLEPN